MVNSMTKGRRSDLNCEAMIMKTTITASPSASPRPEKVVRMSWTWPTNSTLTCAVRGSFLSAASRSLATVPRSRPSTAASTWAARWSWFRSIAIGPSERVTLL